ncbi:MAG: 30S ribosome-binding factor RbfA [candidate division WOR-3 bacterium]|uniref:Ribosome-binding factor A n=1 Tax=candidate division WOR-3 bacterium TaxID=2052148 RepID=A0A7V3ZSE3_UNCW3
MKPYKRSERIGPLLLEVISEIFRNKINDPRLNNIWIYNVEVSSDLKKATVYYSIIKEGKEEDIGKALKKAAGYIKKKISKMVFIRELPEIEFRKVEEREKDGWIH